MKKLILFLILFCYPLSVRAISAESYVVMDYDSKRVLMSHNPAKEKLIASTTKIMTAIIALENGDINSIRTVGEEVLKAYGSAIYLSLGEEITLKDLLYGLMLRSGNDAAIEIAYHISGNMENFVALMNQKAYDIGMMNTVFINNHGLEDESGNGNTSTAYDMALLMRYALTNEIFKEIIGTETYQANDKTCIVVTLNDGNDFQDHKDLCELVFSSYERVQILDKDSLVIDASNPTKYYIKNDFYALLKEEEKLQIRVDYQINSEATGEEVGVANVYLNEELLKSEKVYQREEEKKEESFWQKFLRWLFRW